MIEVGLQLGAAYREGEAESGVRRQDSHTGPVVVGAQGGQLAAWSKGPGDEGGWWAAKTLE